MIWRIADYPELDHLQPHQRARLLATIPWWTYPIVVLRALVPAAIASGLIGAILSRIPPLAQAATPTFSILLPALAASLYVLQLKRLRIVMRKTIANLLQGQRPPFCFACGYNLEGSDALRCPECGHTVADVTPGAT